LELAACLAINAFESAEAAFCVQTGVTNKAKTVAKKRICFIFAEYLNSFSESALGD
jgi:hypothetical protein